jgi:hypothetical protein
MHINATWPRAGEISQSCSVGIHAMTTNEGIVDRALRVIVGLVLIAAALGWFGPAYTSVWGWIGVVPLLTGLVGWCPLYSLLGIKTRAA